MNAINNALNINKGYLLVAVLLMPVALQAAPEMAATEAVSPAEPASLVAPVPFVDSLPSVDYAPLYRQHCSACHGDKGDGKSRAQHALKPPPRNFTTVEAWKELDRDRMIHSVTHGRANTAMVGWQGRFDEVQIAGVVDYVRRSFMREPGVGFAVDKSNLNASPALPVLNSSKRAGDRGRDIYKRNCSACHGDGGNGATWTQSGLNPPPRDFTSSEARALLTRERMIVSVTHGREGTAMMPFDSRLSPGEIATVVDYIRNDFMAMGGAVIVNGSDASHPHAAQPARNHARNHAPGHLRNHPGRNETQGTPASHVAPPTPSIEADMSLQLPHGLVADVAAGREFYMANCFTCHGVRGDGHGPRSSFITPRPRNFLGERARTTLNRPALFRAIAVGQPGTVMPSWSKVLDNQQIANVTEFVFQTFIQYKKKAAAAAKPAPLTTESPETPGKSLTIE